MMNIMYNPLKNIFAELKLSTSNLILTNSKQFKNVYIIKLNF